MNEFIKDKLIKLSDDTRLGGKVVIIYAMSELKFEQI